MLQPGITVVSAGLITQLLGEAVISEGTFENSYVRRDSGGALLYESNISVQVTGTTEITEDVSVTTSAGTFSAKSVVLSNSVTTTNYYFNPSSMSVASTDIQTVTTTASLNLAEDVGLVKAGMTFDYGTALNSAYALKAVSLELDALSGL
jgi:hypothetical protein